MKDIIEFPVMGSKYLPGALMSCSLLTEGDILTLVREPENTVDPNAILVVSALGSIGYVPNRGFSCKECWTHMDSKLGYCTGCGASWDNMVIGGLATRLVVTGSLDRDYACYVKSVIKRNETSTIQAKLVL